MSSKLSAISYRLSASLLASVLGIGTLAGCGGKEALIKLDVAHGEATVHGDYMGDHQGVKLFVERIRAGARKHRERTHVLVDLAFINDARREVRFDCGQNRLIVRDEGGSATRSPEEKHIVHLPQGKVTRLSLAFRSAAEYESFEGGTLHIEGFKAVEPAIAPFSFTIDEAHEH